MNSLKILRFISISTSYWNFMEIYHWPLLGVVPPILPATPRSQPESPSTLCAMCSLQTLSLRLDYLSSG